MKVVICQVSNSGNYIQSYPKCALFSSPVLRTKDTSLRVWGDRSCDIHWQERVRVRRNATFFLYYS